MSPRNSSASQGTIPPDNKRRPRSWGGWPTGTIPVNRIAWGIAIGALVLFFLARFQPPAEMEFFNQLANQKGRSGGAVGLPYFRGPTRLPIPERYIEATRALVRERMAQEDWGGLSLEKRREALLEILFLSGIDTEYWIMPEARQRKVSEAYVRAFLSPRGPSD